MKITLHGKCTADNFQPDARYIWRDALKMFTGKRVTVTIELFRRQRTSPQNRYYWRVLVGGIRDQMVSDGWELSKDEVHELMKGKYLVQEKFNTQTGEVLQTIGSTAALSTVEFSQYNENVRRWAAETIGLTLPEPNEGFEIEY